MNRRPVFRYKDISRYAQQKNNIDYEVIGWLKRIRKFTWDFNDIVFGIQFE
jgi:hypothetical protein